MKNKKFNLSKLREHETGSWYYLEKDVKEAVKRLKERLATRFGYEDGTLEIIDEIFGDKLIK